MEGGVRVGRKRGSQGYRRKTHGAEGEGEEDRVVKEGEKEEGEEKSGREWVDSQ